MKNIKIAVLGATGLVGQTMLNVLRPYPNVTAYAPARHKGQVIEGREIRPMDRAHLAYDHPDVCLLALDAPLSREWAPFLVGQGSVVVDNSSAYRQNPTVPLVVPEVNPEDVDWHRGIVANPNCSTIQAAVALAPLMKWGIERVLYHTYQAVSGAGKKGLADYDNATCEAFPYPIRDNVLPQIDEFGEGDYTKEEIKMREESRKILHAPRLAVSATCIRVPVRNCHTVAVSVWLQTSPSVDEVRAALAGTCRVVDDPATRLYPMPILADGKDEVLVGRVRADPDDRRLYHFVTVADNLRKGAATNAVQIVELLVKRGLLHE